MRRPILSALALTLLWGCSARPPEPAPAPVPAATSSVARTHPRFDDADPHEAIGTRPARYAVHGIDVSRWQGGIDWRTAHAAGVSFAYIKATEGGDVADPAFQTYRQDARSVGLRTGAYHYFYFCRPAAEQARWFIAHVPKGATDLPHVLDMEWNHRSPTCPARPDGARVRAEAGIFLDMLERHYGTRPLVYTTVDFDADTQITRLPRTQFWLRSVAAPAAETFPGTRWTLWQYTGTGLVPGIDRPVDINVFAGSLADWATWGR